MPGILKALVDQGFDCHHPSLADEPVAPAEQEERRPVYKPFENPPAQSDQLKVNDPPPGSRSLFRYFLDGSMRTVNAGYITDPKRRLLPIFMAQIGVAVTELRNNTIALQSYNSKNLLFFPDSLSENDVRLASSVAKDTASASRFPIIVDSLCYEVDQNTPPIDNARKKILDTMHEMEIEKIIKLTDSGSISRDNLLMIDGSLQFYRHIDQNLEAFQNVVGVAKSFDRHTTIGSGRRAMDIGLLIANLKPRYRTPARRVKHRNRSIGAWYLRMHDTRSWTHKLATRA